MTSFNPNYLLKALSPNRVTLSGLQYRNGGLGGEETKSVHSCYLIWPKHFADMTKFRLLIWGDYPGLSKWALNAIINTFKGETEDI